MDYSFLREKNPQMLQEFVRRCLASSMNTCIPGEIVEFDPELQRAKVKCCIRSSFNGIVVDRPEIENVPVCFPYSSTSGFCLTFPVKQGDQCLILFSQASLDKWKDASSVQDPVGNGIPRNFDYNDAIALLGLAPKDFAVQDYQQEMVELRNRSRTARLSFSDSQIYISIAGGTGSDYVPTEMVFSKDSMSIRCRDLYLKSNFYLSGNIAVDGNIMVTGSIRVTKNIEMMGSVRIKGSLMADRINCGDYYIRNAKGFTGVCGPTQFVRFVGGIAVEVS